MRISARTRWWLVAVACAVAPFAAGALGVPFTSASLSGWYAHLPKPFWTPPGYVFGPVWLLLYFLMGSAAVAVWRSNKPWTDFSLKVYFAQLVLNAAWPIVFFGFHLPAVALVVLFALCAMVAWLIALFAMQSRTAAWLLVPYLLWSVFALSLNAGIVALA